MLFGHEADELQRLAAGVLEIVLLVRLNKCEIPCLDKSLLARVVEHDPGTGQNVILVLLWVGVVGGVAATLNTRMLRSGAPSGVPTGSCLVTLPTSSDSMQFFRPYRVA